MSLNKNFKILNRREFWGKCSSNGSIYFGSWKLLHKNRATRSSVAQSCLTLCDPVDCSTPAFPVQHQLLELTQTHVYRVSDAIQPSHPLLSPSPPAFNLSQCPSLLIDIGWKRKCFRFLPDGIKWKTHLPSRQKPDKLP